MGKKYTLPFINNGEPFELSNWTPKKHEAALAELIENSEKIAKKDAEGKVLNSKEVMAYETKYAPYFMILQTLRELNPDVTCEDIDSLHPETIIQLFNAVYGAGKTSIIYKEDFQENPIEKKSKSIGMKS